MRLIAKFYVSAFKQWPGGDAGELELHAVCRGDENKEWAASTPAGSLTLPVDTFDAAGASAPPEVHVLVEGDDDGEWELKACDFAYAGVQVKFERSKRPQGDYRQGTLAMTVNNDGAAKALRQAFAESLIVDQPARFRVWIESV